MANSSDEVPAKKLKLSPTSRKDLESLSREELVEMVLAQQKEIESLKVKTHDPGLDGLMQTVEKLKQQVTDSAQQENKLVLRLSGKEHEVQELMTQIQDIKQSQNPSSSQLSAMLLDPAINLMFYHMKQEMDSQKGKLEQAQNDLAAWKFTPDSQTGKRLMAKCRMLLQENEELGKNVSTGRVAKLEADISLQKTLITEMKKSETATEEFLAEMDDDMEVMQSTVYLMQQQLKDARERLQKYECAGAAPFSSLDAQNSLNSSVGDEASSEEAPTKSEFVHKIETPDNSSISETDCTAVTCWDVATVNSACEAELSGRQALNEIETAGITLDGDAKNHDGFSTSANDAVTIRNSSLRTSPVEPSDLVKNPPTSDGFSCDGDLKSNVVCDGDLACHKLRISGWNNSDVLPDTRVNGLNVLVPMTEEND